MVEPLNYKEYGVLASHPNFQGETIWLGMYRNAGNFFYRSASTPFDPDLHYNNFASGKPDENGNCLALSNTLGREWNNEICTSKNVFACEKQPSLLHETRRWKIYPPPRYQWIQKSLL